MWGEGCKKHQNWFLRAHPFFSEAPPVGPSTSRVLRRVPCLLERCIRLRSVRARTFAHDRSPWTVVLARSPPPLPLPLRPFHRNWIVRRLSHRSQRSNSSSSRRAALRTISDGPLRLLQPRPRGSRTAPPPRRNSKSCWPSSGTD